MPTYLCYEIWTMRRGGGVKDDIPFKLLTSGAIAVSTTMSAPVAIPTVEDDGQEVIGSFTVWKNDNFTGWPLMHIRAADQAAPSGTGAAAASDAQPRMYMGPEILPKRVHLPEGGSFAAVLSAFV